LKAVIKLMQRRLKYFTDYTRIEDRHTITFGPG
jgi:hypothetical protein